MSKLGLWTPYIDLEEMRSWYPKLPGGMEQELQQYVASAADFEPLEEREFRRVYAAAVSYADSSVAPFKLPYHNPDHFRQVVQKGMEILDAYERLSHSKVPLAVRQVVRIALYLHDCHHCGSTLRADAKLPLWRPDLGTKVSVEWVSALAMNEFGVRHNLPLPWRMFMVGMAYASTYGGEAARERGIAQNFPSPAPRSFWFAIMRAADVICDSDIRKFVSQSMAVSIGECPATGRLSTAREVLTGNIGFFMHIHAVCERLNVTSGLKIMENLGWRTLIASHRKAVQRALDGQDLALMRYAEEEARKY